MKFTLALTSLAFCATTNAQLPETPPPLTAADGSKVPSQCSFLYGDPHIFSWDGDHVDCQSTGDFVMAKSFDSDFQIQSRFLAATPEILADHFAEQGWHLGTGTEAIVINTGVEGEPVIEVDARTEGVTSGNQCKMKYYVDGQLVDLGSDQVLGGTVTFERRQSWEKSLWNDNYWTHHFRNFYFEKSGFFMQVTKKYWWKYGCWMNVKICIPDSMKEQRLTGLLGNFDGDKHNDFILRHTNEIISPKPAWDQYTAYCEENWCVPSVEESMFANPDILHQCKDHYDAGLTEAVKNADPEIKAKCKHDDDCIYDAVSTGDIEIGLRTLEEKEAKDRTLDPPPAEETDDTEDDVCKTPEGIDVDCEPFNFEFKCEAIGYDFGFRMDGCGKHPGSSIGGPFRGLELTDESKSCPVGNYDVGSFETACSADGKQATITTLVDGVVKISGASTGLHYTNLKAGETVTLGTAKSASKMEAIEDIEFCFKCPTYIIDNHLVKCAVDVQQCLDGTEVTRDPANDCAFPECPEVRIAETAPPQKGSGSGDPHFKTWTGEKYDYHGECDLVLVDNPSFNNGQGLRVHIRTTRVKYFSFIEKVAIMIGDEVLEFDNDVTNFLINGKQVEENQLHHKTMLAGFIVRRDSRALSIRLHDEGKKSRQEGTVAKIDLHTRKNGFPAVIVDGGKTDVFRGSLGLLGEWGTGKKLGRDGITEFEVDPEDGANFAMEWQVRDYEPMLFKERRFPQWPQVCVPPTKLLGSRLGGTKARLEAEEACAHWKYDKEDCIFDVIATRDIMVAEEGHIVHIE